MFPHLKGFNLQQWIDENRNNWGQRRVIWQDSDFIAFVEKCQESLYEIDIRFDDPSDAVAKASEAMRKDKKLASCKNCGAVLDV
jgi:hypothetical protein